MRSERDDLLLLARRVRGGDEDAAGELFALCWGHAVERAARRLGNGAICRRVDPEDVAQRAIAMLLLGIRDGRFRFAEATGVASLLRCLVHRIVRQVLKRHYAARRDVRRVTNISANDLSPADTESEPDELAVRGEALQRLVKLLRRMNPETRAVLEQRALGSRWGELSERLGIRADTLRMRHRRALESLRQIGGVPAN